MVDLIIFSFEKECSALDTVTGNRLQWTMHMQLSGPGPRTKSQNYSLIIVNLVWILKQRFPCWIRAEMSAIWTQN